MKKRILSCFMALALCLTLLPATARAASGFTVGGETVNTSNWTNSASTASYNDSTGVLTLNGYSGGSIVTDRLLTIKLIGDNNTVTADKALSSNSFCGIGSTSGWANITIKGEGSLTVIADGSTVGSGSQNHGYGITGGAVKIEDSASVKVNVSNFTGDNYAINSSGFTTTSSGALTLEVTKNVYTANRLVGIYASGSVSLGGNGTKAITLDGRGDMVIGIYSENSSNKVTVTDGNLTIKNKQSDSGTGISAAQIDLSANVRIEDVKTGIKSNASSPYGPISIEGGIINITTGSGSAINTRGDLTITGNPVITATRTSTYTNANDGSVVSVNGGKSDIQLTNGGSMTVTGNLEDKLIGIATDYGTTLGTDTAVTTGNWNGDEMKYVGANNGDGTFTVAFGYHPGPAATVDDVTITGDNKNTLQKDVYVTLSNDTFTGTPSGDWITNLPAELTQSVSYDNGGTTARITISGKPTAASNAALAITIPAACLNSGANLTVTTNPDAKFNITKLYDVTITPGAGMSPTGNATQQVNAGTAMTNVFYTAADGYYFPTDYGVSSHGVSVSQVDFTRIKVSGTPTADATITLPAATKKTVKETTPTATFTATGYDTGTLKGVTSDMKYRVGDNGSWNNITGNNETLSGLNSLNSVSLYVVKKGGDTKLDSDAQKIIIDRYSKPANLRAVACTSNANNDGKITGTSSRMVYKLSTETTWSDCVGTEITGLIGGKTYDVRVKESDPSSSAPMLASETVSITVPGYQKPTGAAPVITPNGGSSITSSYVPEQSYTVRTTSASKVANGKFTVSQTSSKKDGTVIITVTPDAGYVADKVTVLDANGKAVEVRAVGENKYEFVMPGSKVTVDATFKPAEVKPVQTASPFVDVAEGTYYYDAVLWAAEKGITGGVDAAHFAPTATVTRGQVVTFLWRAAGCPEVDASSAFADVAQGSYYEKAVAWAVANGITLGTSTATFSPNATCTRGQIVTFLYRYNAMDTLNIKDNPFSDVAEGAYYHDAVLWAGEHGITGGTSATTFSPASNCLRGQVVTFLYRYMGK